MGHFFQVKRQCRRSHSQCLCKLARRQSAFAFLWRMGAYQGSKNRKPRFLSERGESRYG